MPGPIRLLHVITDTDRRGAQVFAVDLARELTARRLPSEVVALTAGTSDGRLDVESIGTSRLGPTTLRSLRRRMGSVELTVAHGSSTGPACALAGLGGRPFVYRQIGDTRFWSAGRRRRLTTGWFLRRARGIVALSGGGRAAIVEHVGADPDRITVIPNAVARDRFPVVSDEERRAARASDHALLGGLGDRFVVAMIGSLTPEKGVGDAIEAVAGLDGVVLVLAGDGADRDELRSLAARLGVDARFLGPVGEPVDVLRVADLVVMPSRSEGMPAALIEAGMCGLAVVASAVGFVDDVVEDGITGVLVPARDVQALRSAIVNLRDDPSRRAELGRAARERCVARFDLDVVADAWATLLERIHSAPDGSSA